MLKWQSEFSSMTSYDIYVDKNVSLKWKSGCCMKTKRTDRPFVIRRYKGLDRNQRICNLSNYSCWRDEHYILFECKNISIMRYRVFAKVLPKPLVYV